MASKSIIGSIAAGLTAWTVPATTASVPDAPVVIVQAQNERGDGSASKPADQRVDCRNAAARAVDQSGGQLLSVRLSGNQCVITILVPGTGDNARPRKMTIQVSR
ncbi:parvulin-like peptidyl-prolyl isomerase [Agrobacterium vitis]|nr:parvulin-like peptidyl-prolyl isomerase [Agrobacterium vitis]MBE1439186.1 parvulin-like peptidyl-prolyl isomerase [Agrobacterium vitis]